MNRTEESSCIRSARKDRPLSRCWPNLKRGQANIAARPNEIDEMAAGGAEKESRNREMSRIPGAPAYVYTDMGDHISPAGGFDARYVAFLETISQFRPRLPRYCARMTGSVLDGEDIVQDALFEAYRKLDQFDETRPLSPWLFRIAHNRCIDFLRHRRAGREAVASVAESEVTMPTEPAILGIGKAVEHLVLTLPPKERACVLLKDVLDYAHCPWVIEAAASVTVSARA